MSDIAFHGSNLIGSDTSGEGTNTYAAVNPKTGAELEGLFHDATDEEIDRAVRFAQEAFEQAGETDTGARAELLERMADEIEALDEVLVDRVTAETGLGAGRVRGERGRTTAQLRMFATLIREGSWVQARIDAGDPGREPTPKPDIRRMLIPLGPVAVFGASNFPLAFSVAGGDTASALAAGCPVIAKAHPAHPGTSELVGEALRRAVAETGFHPGLFSMIHGSRPETGLGLVRHPLLQAVGFTGSLRAGRALFEAAAARPSPIPVYAEMGSVNPIFVLPDAMAERGESIAAGLADSVTLGAGQFCTNPGLVFAVENETLDTFVRQVGNALRAMDDFTMLHAGICEAYRDGVDRLAGVPGVETVGRASADEGRAGAAVLMVEADVFMHHESLHEEVFGPSTLVVRCRDVKEMEQVAASLEGNLTATVHGTESELLNAADLVSRLGQRVGRLIYNGFPTGVEVGHAMHHGGPYPATTDARSTSVGTAAIERFVRPICYQDFPQQALPVELRDRNERGIWRMVDGEMTQGDV